MGGFTPARIVFCVSIACFELISFPTIARDLVYQPINPAFGGSPLNGSYILGLATANNRFRISPEARKQQNESAAGNSQQFERQITSALLSQIATTIGQQILGENARNSGTFAVGGTRVDFQRQGDQISVDITEAASGGRTNILIPAPQF